MTLKVIRQNIQDVRTRIAEACRRAARDPSEVTLIAVSKTFPAAKISEAAAEGIADFGENYVQELREKQGILDVTGIRWHFVGHLQTNKIRYIAEWIHLVHAVDTVRLARALSSAGQKTGRTIPFLVEVNTTGESSKFGISPREVEEFAQSVEGLPGVRLDGLMTMGPFSDNPEDSRGAFRTLRELAGKLRTGSRSLPHLSMGMTGDFEVAIEEGATLLRVGTAIFGARTKAPAASEH